MHKLSIDHQGVLSILDDLGITYKLMGGYPRDLALGLGEPKDLDVAIYGCSDHKVEILTQKLVALNLVEHLHAEPPSLNGDPRLKVVINTKVGADLIIWGDAFKHWWDIARAFDVNLNLFVMNHMSNFNGTPRYEPVYVGDNYGVLSLISNLTVSQERLAKMQAKARDAGWEVDEDMYKMLPDTQSDQFDHSAPKI